MTLEEIYDRYDKAVKKAEKELEEGRIEYLKEHDLYGKVLWERIGKVGWLRLNSMKEISFYPMKKDGTMSQKSCGWFFQNDIPKLFIPYKEEE